MKLPPLPRAFLESWPRGGFASTDAFTGDQMHAYASAAVAAATQAMEAERDALQAKLDRLMLEYCPEEMTPEQLANWAKHQRPVL